MRGTKTILKSWKIRKTNLHANKLQELTSKDSQYDQEIEEIKLNGVAKCPLSEPNTFIVDGGCYMFVDQEKTFANAKNYCASKQARLFEPRSLHTNKLVYQKSKVVLRGERNWLGVITKNGKFGPWKFANSGDNVIQIMWAPSQPNASSNKICAYHGCGGEKWCDAGCSSKYRFICEFV